MAKRMKLEAPSADDLARMEVEFRRETSPRGVMAAPIAQVAADTARAHDPRDAEARAASARDRNDAERLREAEGRGLVLLEIPLERVEAEAIVRDRMALDPESMKELQLSIAAQGLRLPVEVFRLPGTGTGQGERFGLLSGYRRLRAVQNLRGLTGDAKYDTIRAIVREPDAMGGTFAAMVEENEVRAGLSHFERGRIAVIAAQQGAFPNVEAAVDALFPVASKGKRSKIRSFALIFEELGDMLLFPDALREKDGLRLAGALREGHEGRLRDALADGSPETPAEELAVLEEAMTDLGPAPARPSRGGRPRTRAPQAGRSAAAAAGFRLRSGRDAKGWFIRFEGERVDAELVDVALRELERLLSPPR
ncbi:ParB N-terminal domain-containing protein [Falsirhodobacter sp. 20TX0035]|uniref:ParB N-terminal domain-containing protein n=1 Tax=Falsirhodobacter sp. 20TX0035 TaxID=3022019 RepID=UPI00232D934B|nr:ParB N-terminal domain-containing protein [Falsirhodobacter sp. 20TX0035]MDB6452866.1 ParB N-terminal domain-containing protein [Falsirhodobacter sp. 20TX0035]